MERSLQELEGASDEAGGNWQEGGQDDGPMVDDAGADSVMYGEDNADEGIFDIDDGDAEEAVDMVTVSSASHPWYVLFVFLTCA
jgi:hypothetical protein